MDRRPRQHQPASREQVAAILRQRFERFERGLEGARRGIHDALAPQPDGGVPAPAPGAGAPPGVRPPGFLMGDPRAPFGPLLRPRAVRAAVVPPRGGGLPPNEGGPPVLPPMAAPPPGEPLIAPPPPPPAPELPPLPPAHVLMMEEVVGDRFGGVRVAAAGGRGGGHHRPPPFFRQASVSSSSPPPEEEEDLSEQARTTNVTVDGDIIAYAPQDDQIGAVGLFISGRPPTSSRPFFEVEILERGAGATPDIVVGLCSRRHPPDLHPGWTSGSVGLHAGDGALYRGRPRGQPFGPACDVGDRLGCGMRVAASAAGGGGGGGGAGGGGGGQEDVGGQKAVGIFFTRNGKEIASGAPAATMPLPPGGLFPAVGMQRQGEEVCLRQGLSWSPDEEDMMLVDGGEDEWVRLHDVRLNGQVLEYVGRGKSLVDVGLAQARTPVCTRNHYFEIEIVDPGASCYIAIGLARRDYPRNRHPGWNKGSIAYHADDGKVFVGSGVGAPFGPRCHKGDVMGCGVLFPRNYECKSDSEEELEQQAGGGVGGAGGAAAAGGGADGAPARVAAVAAAMAGEGGGGGGGGGEHDYAQVEEFGSDSADDDDEEDDEWWHDRVFIQSGVRVQIYFTRNGKVIGKKDVRIPKGGFYPTIGMMSCREKVRVDLRPLSG